ncbi:MAG: ADP-ribose pyrophosphatase [Actinomycetia bacterium]|nr:ADP-ribose pyrophosphatase [Actinomycetes bacterium]
MSDLGKMAGGSSGDAPESIPAATVIILRDGPDGIETLLLRKNKKLGFAAGMWVFPGGRLDPEDRDPERPDDDEAAARRGAIREAAEEAGLVVDPAPLVALSHWTPPLVEIKRYATWFFLAEASGAAVEIDGGEIVEHEWVRPVDALAKHAAGEVTLLPPTWITLDFVARQADVASALAAAEAAPLDVFVTKFGNLDGEAIGMWEGDAGYEAGDPSATGARHRINIGSLPWRYERD